MQHFVAVHSSNAVTHRTALPEFTDVPPSSFHDIVNEEEIMMWFDFFSNWCVRLRRSDSLSKRKPRGFGLRVLDLARYPEERTPYMESIYRTKVQL